jgi:hypothetical protein
MTCYICHNCPVVFEIGYYGYWDTVGGCVKYVCKYCGTMHKIEHESGKPDLLSAVDGPIRELKYSTVTNPDKSTFEDPYIPVTEDSWKLIGPLPTGEEFLGDLFILPHRAKAVELSRIHCAYCRREGGLVTNEWPLDRDGNWPIFGDNCPVCHSTIDSVYHDTIN